jgi:DNA-binding NtrC family response regulator
MVLVRQGPLMDLEQCLRRGLAGAAELVFRSATRDVRLPATSLIDATVLDIAAIAERDDGSPMSGELELVRNAAQVPQVVCVLPRQDVPALVRTIERTGADFVVRPFEPEELVLRVRRAVGRARHGGRRREHAGDAAAISDDTLDTDVAEEGLSFMRFREAMQRSNDRAARAYLTALLRKVDGEVAKAARHAGVERESLHRLLRKYDVRAGEFRSRGADSETR